jgi:hypothetical protein
MADIETALVDALETVTAAGGRVWPMSWPQDATWPGITYQLIARTPEHALNRAVGSWRDRWQIDCWATTYGAVVALAGAVTTALLAFHGATPRVIALGIEDGGDMAEPATALYRRRVEAVIRYA